MESKNKSAASPVGAAAGENERNRIQRVIGGIGAKPRLRGKIINAAFVAAVCGAFLTSVLTTGIFQTAFIDLGLVLISLKLAYHLHTEARVNHAQFWIMTAIEDRLLDVMRELRELRKQLRELPPARQPDDPSGAKAAQAIDLQDRS